MNSFLWALQELPWMPAQACPVTEGSNVLSAGCFLSSLKFFFFLIYSVSECGSVHGPFPMSFLSVQMSDVKQEHMYVWQLPNKLGEDQVKDNCSGLSKKTQKFVAGEKFLVESLLCWHQLLLRK